MASRAVSRWAPYAAAAHRRYRRVPTSVLLGLTQIESAGIEGRTSSAQAKGLTQFVPGTARQYHVNTAPGHARSQFVGAAHYLSDLVRQYGGIRPALYHYSGGSSSYPGMVLSAARGYRRAARRANRGAGAGGGRGGRQGPDVHLSGGVTAVPGSLPAPVPGGTGLADYLAGSLPQRPQVAASPPPTPTFSARAALPFAGAYGPSLESGPPVPATRSVDDALAQIRQLTGETVPQVSGGSVTTNLNVSSSGGGGGRVAAGPAGRGHYPLARRGKLIGFPFQGTHTLGDWESDNAVDISVPKGTPVRAVVSGTIGPQIGSLGRGGRFAGLRVHLAGHGNEWYYAHLSRLAVHAGQHVKRGQIIGYSGEANGVQHLHFGQKHGDPRRTLRR